MLRRSQVLQNRLPYCKFSEICHLGTYSNIFYHHIIDFLLDFLNICLFISFSRGFWAVFHIYLHLALLIFYLLCVRLLWSCLLYFLLQIMICVKINAFLLWYLYLFHHLFYHSSDLCLLYYTMINGHFFSYCLHLVLKHLKQTNRAEKRLEKQKLCRQMHGNHSPRPPFWPILNHFYSLLFNYTPLAHF